ncbi:YXWGXW repeat-containing protein [Granulicella rosea]|uniref:YXWGXW repeat-containing protein n=1 Tax=Granulicella rosea TaxID=474952 RepID=A0A239DBW9_9BACT|nr:YXWGXW repeat-containing protein [Granulicella rosea]SNS29906.1 YXWGXW repeat-containing protein [Granulicella rosea]
MKRTKVSGTYGKIWTATTALGIATLSLSLAATGCKSNTTSGADGFVQQQNQTGADPAAANLAPANESTTQTSSSQQSGQVLGIRAEGQTTQQGESYQNGPAPIVRQAPSGGYAQDDSQYYDNGAYQTDVDAGQAALEADQAPPPLPVYTQPEAPEPDDLWTPGYWDYAPSGGYYWVPGAWVAAPYAGALWTPGYWGYYGNRYRFHRGYWGLHIGFYGGIPYGFGYTGFGYEGGYWNNNHFFYNRAVNRINVNTFHNVYVRNVTVTNNVRVSYNGGPGGLNVRPRPAEIAALRENHTPPMQAQIQHARQAQGDRQQFFNQNHGAPAQAVVTRNLPADRGIQAPARGGFGGGARPTNTPAAGAPRAVQGPERGGFGQQQPNRVAPNQMTQPHVQQPNQRFEPNQQQAHPQPQQNRQAEPQRPAQPNPQVQRNMQVQQQHAIQQPARPQEAHRAQPQAQPRPQPEARPQPQQARPQPEQRPAPQPQQARPQPQVQPHPQPQQPHPQAQPHPAPAEHEGHH